MPINEALLEEKLAALESARPWNPRVVSRLENFIRSADDYDLFRVNPLQFAADKNMDENEALDLFLYAAHYGVFEIDWYLVCPVCTHIVENFGELNNLHAHFTCDFCSLVHEATLDDFIQVAFTLSRQVRAIAYHQPESLPIKDYYYRYHFVKGVRRFPAGYTRDEIFTTITRVMTDLQPGQRLEVELDVPAGMLQAKDLLNNATLVMFAGEETQPEAENLPLIIREGGFEGDFARQEVDYGVAQFAFRQTTPISNGKKRLEFANLTGKRSPLWIVHYPAGFQPSFAEFEPFLSGKRLLTSQTFRTLFRSQIIGSDEGIAVQDITFLFTDLKGSTAMYDRVGDPKAYFLVRQHFETLTQVIADHNGAVVKTIGDAVMATFMTPLAAVAAAQGMLHALGAYNRTISEPLHLKIGIHSGHSIAVTLNERVDYFGQTVNIAARVQALADADEIYLSEDAYRYPGVRELLAGWRVAADEVEVKGVRQKLKVYKIQGNAS